MIALVALIGTSLVLVAYFGGLNRWKRVGRANGRLMPERGYGLQRPAPTFVDQSINSMASGLFFVSLFGIAVIGAGIGLCIGAYIADDSFLMEVGSVIIPFGASLGTLRSIYLMRMTATVDLVNPQRA